jgi:hypothetical protein
MELSVMGHVSEPNTKRIGPISVRSRERMREPVKVGKSKVGTKSPGLGADLSNRMSDRIVIRLNR